MYLKCSVMTFTRNRTNVKIVLFFNFVLAYFFADTIKSKCNYIALQLLQLIFICIARNHLVGVANEQ